MLQTAPLYEAMSDLLKHAFIARPHPGVLDLAKNLLVLFAHNDKHCDVSQSLFDALCEQTLKMFAQNTIREHPDVLEAFMSFLGQVGNVLVCLCRCVHVCALRVNVYQWSAVLTSIQCYKDLYSMYMFCVLVVICTNAYTFTPK